jgi:hypothetical protein
LASLTDHRPRRRWAASVTGPAPQYALRVVDADPAGEDSLPFLQERRDALRYVGALRVRWRSTVDLTRCASGGDSSPSIDHNICRLSATEIAGVFSAISRASLKANDSNSSGA